MNFQTVADLVICLLFIYFATVRTRVVWQHLKDRNAVTVARIYGVCCVALGWNGRISRYVKVTLPILAVLLYGSWSFQLIGTLSFLAVEQTIALVVAVSLYLASRFVTR
ncbi:hypothetical protein D3C85_377680 [compost metagenome]